MEGRFLRSRRRKCRRPKFASQQAAEYFRDHHRRDPRMSAYECTAHDPPKWHLTSYTADTRTR